MRITQHDEKPPERLPILEGVRSYLQGILAKATKVALERVRTNQPLTAYGVDSVMRATINQQISKDFPDISKTLMFEYETLDEIANYLYRNQEKNCQKLVSVTVVNRDKSLLSKETAGTQNPSIDLTVENITSEKRLPLSIMQSQLYSTYLADPCSAEYNMGVAVRFRGPYKPVIFRKALKLILNRHEALRMSINTEGNQWEVTVSPQVEIDLPLFSLEEEPSPVIREQRLNALIEKYKDQPINLSQSPLMRVFLVQLDKEEYVFIAVFHHIIMDGWSLSVFTKDLSHYCQMLLHESKNHQALPPAYQY